MTLVLLISLYLMATSAMASPFVPKRLCAIRHYSRSISPIAVRGGSDSNVPLPPQSNSNMPPPELETASVQPNVENAILSQPTTQVPVEMNQLEPKASSPGSIRQRFPDFPWHRVPNWLTYARCLSIPMLIGVFYLTEKNALSSLIFALASFTDYLDGYLARKWDVASPFGAFLDPVVRVILFLVAFNFVA